MPVLPPLPVPVQPGPTGHGHCVSLAQLQTRTPDALGAWHTQYPTFTAPDASKYWPPGRPWLLLQAVHAGTSQVGGRLRDNHGGQIALATPGRL